MAEPFTDDSPEVKDSHSGSAMAAVMYVDSLLDSKLDAQFV